MRKLPSSFREECEDIHFVPVPYRYEEKDYNHDVVREALQYGILWKRSSKNIFKNKIKKLKYYSYKNFNNTDNARFFLKSKGQHSRS